MIDLLQVFGGWPPKVASGSTLSTRSTLNSGGECARNNAAGPIDRNGFQRSPEAAAIHVSPDPDACAQHECAHAYERTDDSASHHFLQVAKNSYEHLYRSLLC